ncbi:MAG: pyridoxal phosphate-dependent aminotransferase, partial [Bacteroidales bacterium]|nr:pyridoxal phosphate-dependent aminotransferase [Bacteroidales bacterium]
MKNNFVPIDTANKLFKESGHHVVGNAGIREIKKLADQLEAASGVHFIHMEMGNPGLPAVQVGVE